MYNTPWNVQSKQYMTFHVLSVHAFRLCRIIFPRWSAGSLGASCVPKEQTKKRFGLAVARSLYPYFCRQHSHVWLSIRSVILRVSLAHTGKRISFHAFSLYWFRFYERFVHVRYRDGIDRTIIPSLHRSWWYFRKNMKFQIACNNFSEFEQWMSHL